MGQYLSACLSSDATDDDAYDRRDIEFLEEQAQRILDLQCRVKCPAKRGKNQRGTQRQGRRDAPYSTRQASLRGRPFSGLRACSRATQPSIDLESRNLVGHEKSAPTPPTARQRRQPHDADKRKAERPAGTRWH